MILTSALAFQTYLLDDSDYASDPSIESEMSLDPNVPESHTSEPRPLAPTTTTNDVGNGYVCITCQQTAMADCDTSIPVAACIICNGDHDQAVQDGLISTSLYESEDRLCIVRSATIKVAFPTDEIGIKFRLCEDGVSLEISYLHANGAAQELHHRKLQEKFILIKIGTMDVWVEMEGRKAGRGKQFRDMTTRADLPLILTFQIPIICVTADGLCLYHVVNYAISNGQMAMTNSIANDLRTRLINHFRATSIHEEANRLMLDGSEAYPGQTNIVAMCGLLQMSIALNVSFLDERWTKGRVEVYWMNAGQKEG